MGIEKNISEKKESESEKKQRRETETALCIVKAEIQTLKHRAFERVLIPLFGTLDAVGEPLTTTESAHKQYGAHSGSLDLM